MRVLSRLVIVGISAAMVAAPVSGQRPDDQIEPRSLALLKSGEALLASGKFIEADDALEAALAVDPRNRQAYVVMAQVAQKQKLYGQAIRFTNRALELDPYNRQALAVQGEAMVEAGATPRARVNLEKLQRLCPSGCSELSALSSAIARGPTIAEAKASVPAKTN